MKNWLYYEDNLKILKKVIEPETVDLIYLDPPFNSKATYNVLYGKGKVKEQKSQVEAFKDTWQWTNKSRELYERLSGSQELGKLVSSLYSLLGEVGMLNYLMYMAERLIYMRRVLKDTGNIYLHCDPTASHYLKIVMDNVFGKENFRNEVIWDYSRSKGLTSAKEFFPRKHDILFFYVKNNKAKSTFHIQRHKVETSILERIKEQAGDYFYCDDKGYMLWERIKHKTGNQAKRFYKKFRNEYGRDPKDGDRILYVKDPIVKSVWGDIEILNHESKSKESTGYATQKPLALLERIIKTSSNKGDVVLDPFCGCGTSVSAAEKLGRKWIGIDISYFSINLIENRLKDEYKVAPSTYKVSGVPTDFQGAKDLLRRTIGRYVDHEPETLEEAIELAKSGNLNAKHKRNSGRFEFQRWVCGELNALPSDREIGDGGVDGTLKWLNVDLEKETTVTEVWGAVQVKSTERVTTDDVRALKGVISNGNGFMMGIIVCLYKTDTPEIRRICSNFKNPTWSLKGGIDYPRLQVFSVEEIFDGRKPLMPDPVVPYKMAEFKGNRNLQVPLAY